MEKVKVAFICVHNSCRSQMAEALGKKYLSDICECYSAGTETKPQINQDAVRLMKIVHGIDMEESQYSKLFEDIPETDIVVSMGCNVVCPYIPGKLNLNWGLEDPSGQSDEKFLEIMNMIEENIHKLRDTVLEMNT
ncbi:MAG: arsenate reductase ArsC [Ruminococcaceae bacterium]|nr:arsenate reductase ArsC [Oscillospiraceae bacterium]